MTTTILINNDFGVKVLSLSLMLVLIGLLWYFSRDMNKDSSYYHLFLYIISRYLTLVFLLTSPFIMLLTSNRISFEIFVYFLASIYLLGFVLGLGLFLLYSKKQITSFFNKETYGVYREKKKYNR